MKGDFACTPSFPTCLPFHASRHYRLLPPGYDAAADATRLFYLQDGQNLFDPADGIRRSGMEGRRELRTN